MENKIDRIAANSLICAYMEMLPKWNVGMKHYIIQVGDVWSINNDKQKCIDWFCEGIAKYDTSWEWIMPVVEKIRKEKWNTHQVYFNTSNDYVEVYAGNFGDGFYLKIDGSGISSIYEAVVKYLEL